jgi:hypothetical protein
VILSDSQSVLAYQQRRVSARRALTFTASPAPAAPPPHELVPSIIPRLALSALRPHAEVIRELIERKRVNFRAASFLRLIVRALIRWHLNTKQHRRNFNKRTLFAENAPN